jgi:hypothetical protein
VLDAIRPLEPGTLGSIGGWFSNGGMEVSPKLLCPFGAGEECPTTQHGIQDGKSKRPVSELRTWGP